MCTYWHALAHQQKLNPTNKMCIKNCTKVHLTCLIPHLVKNHQLMILLHWY